MITIDGSFGEGGGQIIRSSLALSMITGKPVCIENVRAKRKKPGLRQQHVTAIRAAAAVSQANVEGDEVRSSMVVFEPGKVSSGEYHFPIHTAGSSTLVFQTVLPALLTADGPSHIRLEGGTHNPMAPPFDFLAKCFAPAVHKMGPTIEFEFDRHGFYPAGGGRWTATVNPSPDGLKRIDIHERGAIRKRHARALVSNLPDHITERELKTAGRKLGWPEKTLSAERVESNGPGNVVMIEVECDHTTEIFTACGEFNKKAEVVANEAVRACKSWLDSDAPVGEYLADQLLLPMAIAGGGSFRTTTMSLQTTTHIELIQKFVDVNFEVEERAKNDHVVTVST